MVLSMTGFGRGEVERDKCSATVEVRSVNGRFLEVNIHMPEMLSSLQPKVVELVKARVSRGRVNVTVGWKGGDGQGPVVDVDIERARIYRDSFLKLRDELKLTGEVDIGLLLNLPDVLRYQTEPPDPDLAWNLIREACELAINGLLQMRRAEGERLCEELNGRICAIEETVSRIEALMPDRVKWAKEKLRERVEILLGTHEMDEQRLATEVAILAQRCDVTEECVRLHSHNKEFLKILEKENAVGKRLVFLLQEMNREVNTIGAKADDAVISHLVVDLKEEIEKLREQVQNIE